MNKKILGILVSILIIIASVLPVSGSTNEKTEGKANFIDLIPVIDFLEIKGGLLRLSTTLINTGEGNAYNLYWEMRVLDGLFFHPKMIYGEIPLIKPGEQVEIKISPALGLGLVTIEFYCRYLIQGMYCETEIEIKQEWKDRALIIFHTFPESIQPVKEWMVIENYSYHETDELEVLLIYKDILNMHNLRVVAGSDSTQLIEFRGACCFEDGIGHLKECWVTRDLVESGIGYWEVEIVDEE